MRRLAFLAALLCAAPAAAQETEAEDETAPAARVPGDPAEIEVGPRLGLQTGVGGVTPGGLRVGGLFLAQMTERTWFDTELAFTFGGGGRDCWVSREPDHPLECGHGIADGFGVQVNVGGRWYGPRLSGALVPYLRGGLGLHVARFGDDGVTGVALPFWLGAGGRFGVTEAISVGGELLLDLGPSLYSDGMGIEPYAAMTVQFGVELAL